jgi:SAM-dependent methyltransferase
MIAEPNPSSRARRLFSAVIKPPYVWLRRRMITVLFDRRYGVYTADVVSLEALGVAADGRRGYIPSAWLTLRRALPRREVTNDDVFIDVGSGMGRVVFQAALTYPFRRVIGVEIAKQLHDIAEENIARNRDRLRCSTVLLVQADVTQFDIPDDVTVVFLYNPFAGAIFEEFVRRLLASVDRLPRLVRIIYMNPQEEAALLATGRVRLVRSLRGWRPAREWSRSNSTRIYAVSAGPPEVR